MDAHKDLDFISEFDDSTVDQSDLSTFISKFPYRPTLFLGLGGTGVHTIKKIKNLFSDFYGTKIQASTDSVVPATPPMYNFLGFDTNQEEDHGILGPDEWHHLGVDDVQAFYRHMAKDHFFKDWLVQGYSRGALNSGCNGIRNLGRLALINNIATVQQKIEQANNDITQFDTKNITSTPVVYIFCSMSGGTGSGMLLDTCFLLRHLMPDATLVGFIGVLTGLPGMPKSTRDQMLVNTICGLKELNAFMTETAEGVEFGENINYPFGVTGKIDTPLDECHLISNQNSKGAISLPTHDHVSSLLARMVFMMSAYYFENSQGQKVPGYNGIMDNNKLPLQDSVRGARTCYMVPGMCQIHFPAHRIANWLTIKTAIEYLEYQCGGNKPAGKAEAENFFQLKNLDFSSLRDSIKMVPGENTLYSGIDYSESLDSLLVKGKERYGNREEILLLGDNMVKNRRSQVGKILEKNVTLQVSKIMSNVHKESARLLVKDGYLAMGAIDFLEDLSELLKQEQVKIKQESISGTDQFFNNLSSDWNDIKTRVEDVSTKSGTIDSWTDKRQLPSVKIEYSEFLRFAEATVLQKTHNELTIQLYTELEGEIAKTLTELEKVFLKDLPATIKILKSKLSDIASVLHNESEGSDSSVKNICSFNAISQEWREQYFDKKIPHRDAILNQLLSRNWHPWDLLEAKPKGKAPLHSHLANIIVSEIKHLTENIRRFSPERFIKESQDSNIQGTNISGNNPADIIAKLYHAALHPQIKHNLMKAYLQRTPFEIVFCGGLKKELKNQLLTTETFKQIGANNLHVADNLEPDRLNFFSITLPIAMAGLDMIEYTFMPAYNNWLKEIDLEQDKKRKQYQIAQYHCFPGSFSWPSPNRIIQQIEEEQEFFAKTLAISEILQVSDIDKEKLNTLKGPKNKSYGIFKIGTSQYWLTPFFEPFSSAEDKIQGELIKLGSNIGIAYKTFINNEICLKHAKMWIESLENNWFNDKSSKDFAEAKARAIDSFKEKNKKTNDLKQTELWGQIELIIKKWRIG